MLRTQARVSAPRVRAAWVVKRVGVAAAIVAMFWRPTHQDVVVGAGERAVDVLFVVDDSSSMSDDQQRLAANFDGFFGRAIAGSDVDVRLAVTTTDMESRLGGLVAPAGGAPFLDRSTAMLPLAFANRVSVGTNGSTDERGLDALEAALLKSENARFLRDDAALAVVIVSDEEDAGHRDPKETITALRTLKPAGVPILVAGVVQPDESRRYQEVLRAFHGDVLDINGDWGERLGDLGAATLALSRSVWLAHDADAGSVSVSVGGVSDVPFVVDGNRVVLADAPVEGARVVVDYRERDILGVKLLREVPGVAWSVAAFFASGTVDLVEFLVG